MCKGKNEVDSQPDYMGLIFTYWSRVLGSESSWMVVPKKDLFVWIPKYYTYIVHYYPFMDQSCRKGKLLQQWSYEPCHAGATQRLSRSLKNFWENVVHWRKKMANHSVFLPGELRTVWKCEKMTLEDEPSFWRYQYVNGARAEGNY